ncbi:type III polyketide synthase [Mucilaginibacter sp.]
MSSCITAIGTANPEFRVNQQDAFEFMVKTFALDGPQARRLYSIYEHSGIEHRYTAVADFKHGQPEAYTFFENRPDDPLYACTRSRLKLYQQEAIKVGVQAARNLAAQFDKDIFEQITHLITISCTGMYAPGLDIDLVDQLNLKRTTERTCITFMGCYGAVNGLKTADYICRANPQAKVLVVSAELCTLHFQKEQTLDNWVANSLFSDGSAAALVEHTSNRTGSKPCLELNSFYSEFMPDSRNEMGWYIGNTGFEMKLTPKVPRQIQRNIKAITERMTAKAGLTPQQIGAYAVHPGGRKILEAVEQALDLPEESNAHSYEVLRQYGNMSSATILFVLNRMLSAGGLQGEHVASYAFGPGLTVEGMVLTMQ